MARDVADARLHVGDPARKRRFDEREHLVPERLDGDDVLHPHLVPDREDAHGSGDGGGGRAKTAAIRSGSTRNRDPRGLLRRFVLAQASLPAKQNADRADAMAGRPWRVSAPGRAIGSPFTYTGRLW